MELSRWEALTPEQRKKFPPLAPDFVIELRSATDRLPPLREKMEEYRANGVRLGLLIDPQKQQVEIYRSSLLLHASFESQVLFKLRYTKKCQIRLIGTDQKVNGWIDSFDFYQPYEQNSHRRIDTT